MRNEKINILSRLLRTMVSSKGLGPAQEIIRNKKGAKQLHRDVYIRKAKADAMAED